jgi:hypothetical protein
MLLSTGDPALAVRDDAGRVLGRLTFDDVRRVVTAAETPPAAEDPPPPRAPEAS